MKGEIYFNIIVSIFAFFLFIYSFTIPEGIGQKAMSPNIWPAILLILVSFLSGILFVNSLREKKEKRKNIFEEPNDKNDSILSKKLFISLILIFMYFFLLPYLGAIISSIIFLIIYIYILDIRKFNNLIIFPIFFVYFVVLLFGKILSIPLPRGIAIFRTFSSLFY